MGKKDREKSNILIKKRRRKRLLKGLIIFFILLASVLAILCFKLPYFNVKSITVENVRHIPKAMVIKQSNITLGANIFYLNTSKIKALLKQNTYIEDVTIKRKLPDSITIFVTERKAEFYLDRNGSYYILDNNGIIVEATNDINGRNLIPVVTSSMDNPKIGKVIPSKDKREIKTLGALASLIEVNTSNVAITKVDISDLLNITLYSNNMSILIGTLEDLNNKLNKAVDILSQEAYKNAKGYVDVRFNGIPAVYTEK